MPMTTTASVPRRGVPIVVSAPSGGGKTTMCRQLTAHLDNIASSVSHTTRAPRPHEKPGEDYHFVDEEGFQTLIRQGSFLEWAKVYGRFYGTTLGEAHGRLAAGVDVLFDIDVQGGRQILQKLPEAVLVFVVPPSMGELERRLRGRKSDTSEQIALRLQAAATEIQAATFYTHWIVNDSLPQAVRELETIVCSERLRHIDKTALMQQVLAS
ncbi:MAG: guanylate kinase [Deltaproteobacteria bacterium]|nr:MAG: guanylate kinase [Deltaproteobacteria bacterium]